MTRSLADATLSPPPRRLTTTNQRIHTVGMALEWRWNDSFWLAAEVRGVELGRSLDPQQPTFEPRVRFRPDFVGCTLRCGLSGRQCPWSVGDPNQTSLGQSHCPTPARHLWSYQEAQPILNMLCQYQLDVYPERCPSAFSLGYPAGASWCRACALGRIRTASRIRSSGTTEPCAC